jgi:hypothetical protein
VLNARAFINSGNMAFFFSKGVPILSDVVYAEPNMVVMGLGMISWSSVRYNVGYFLVLFLLIFVSAAALELWPTFSVNILGKFP